MGVVWPALLTWFVQGQIGQRVHPVGRSGRGRNGIGRRRGKGRSGRGRSEIRGVEQRQADRRPSGVLRGRDARLAVHDRRVARPARRLNRRAAFARLGSRLSRAGYDLRSEVITAIPLSATGGLSDSLASPGVGT